MPNIKENMDLIKGYELKNLTYAFGILDNFRLLSDKSKGLKLILIDNISNIINSWVKEIVNNKANSANEEQKKYYQSTSYFLYIFNDIFQQFLSKITSIQKCYQIQCFISLNINISDHIEFTKYSQRNFRAIFPFIRTAYYLSKLPNEDIIIFNEFRISLNGRNEKYEYNIIDNENEDNNNEKNIYENDIDYLYLKEFIEKKKKKNKKCKNATPLDKVNEWMKNTIGEFVNNINKYKIFKKQLEEQNKQEEDSSCTQYDK